MVQEIPRVRREKGGRISMTVTLVKIYITYSWVHTNLFCLALPFHIPCVLEYVFYLYHVPI